MNSTHDEVVTPIPSVVARGTAAESPSDEPVWTVIVEIRRPDTATYHVHPSVYPAACDAMAELGAAVPALRVLDHSVVISYRVRAGLLRLAQDHATKVINEVCLLLNLPVTAVIAQRVLSNTEVTELLGAPAAPVPSVVGLSEAAEIVGVSRQRLHQLTAHPDFPQPLRQLKAGPVWLEEQIADYARRRNTLVIMPSAGEPTRRTVRKVKRASRATHTRISG